MGCLFRPFNCSSEKVFWVTRLQEQPSRDFRKGNRSCHQKPPRDVLYKTVLVKITKNSQKNLCPGVSFLIKLQPEGSGKRIWYRCISVNFSLLTSILQNTCERLLLKSRQIFENYIWRSSCFDRIQGLRNDVNLFSRMFGVMFPKRSMSNF